MAIYLVRHGETEWSVSRRHTGMTDLALTPTGEDEARTLRLRLADVEFDKVVSSPLQRAVRTAELAGYGSSLKISPLLAEFDYGEYEGLTSEQIEVLHPGWELWRDGCPGGETPDQALARCRRQLDELELPNGGNSLLFGHGHIFRSLTAAYLRQPAEFCAHLILKVASISILDQEHGQPAIDSWDLI
jgi:probable phosphoglycerate mutase